MVELFWGVKNGMTKYLPSYIGDDFINHKDPVIKEPVSIGGGNSNIFLDFFTPKIGKGEAILTHIFSTG